MKVGTKSVLFGAHCFLIHWFFVALGWFHLYRFRRVLIGRRTTLHTVSIGDRGDEVILRHMKDVYTSLWDFRLWVAFVIHDLGYWGKPNMDGPEGESHPEWACNKMQAWFGNPWGAFVLYHSRFYAKNAQVQVSALCYADKMGIVFTPSWLYLPMVRATGEIKEYMKLAEVMNDGAGGGKYASMSLSTITQKAWFADVQSYMVRWVDQHKDGKDDTWTPNSREKFTPTGVWK